VLEDEEDPIDRIGTATETAQAWMQAITEAVYAGETFRAYLSA